MSNVIWKALSRFQGIHKLQLFYDNLQDITILKDVDTTSFSEGLLKVWSTQYHSSFSSHPISWNRTGLVYYE